MQVNCSKRADNFEAACACRCLSKTAAMLCAASFEVPEAVSLMVTCTITSAHHNMWKHFCPVAAATVPISKAKGKCKKACGIDVPVTAEDP